MPLSDPTSSAGDVLSRLVKYAPVQRALNTRHTLQDMAPLKDSTPILELDKSQFADPHTGWDFIYTTLEYRHPEVGNSAEGTAKLCPFSTVTL